MASAITENFNIGVLSNMFCVNRMECTELFHIARRCWAIKISNGKHHSRFINSDVRKTSVHFSKSAISLMETADHTDIMRSG